jgi:hypothetical protein
MAGIRAWTDHLPAGVDPGQLDLLADESLIGRIERHWRSGTSGP